MYAEELLHTEASHTQKLLHTASFHTQKLLYTASFYTEELFNREATVRSFYTEYFTHSKLLN